jgi:preprotein translocase subunit YajC
MAPPAGGKSDPISQFLPLILIVVVFYVFMILPQMRRTKAQKKFREAIGKGDKVVLTSGIHGKIIDSDETTFVIETEGQNKLKIDKAAVSMESTAAVYPKS